jgi:hypothetical protein
MKTALIVALGVLVALAILVVLYSGARRRALLSHCRNNLRHMGGLAARNWNGLDPRKTGRAFWQQVREAQYKDVRGKWQPMVPDPFVCPVLGSTESRADDPKAIDYRGPRIVRDLLKETPKAEPLGADRAGNHPSGGHVLRLDTSVDEAVPLIDAADAQWREAEKALKD